MRRRRALRPLPPPPRRSALADAFPATYEQLVARIQAQHPEWSRQDVEAFIAREARAEKVSDTVSNSPETEQAKR